MARATGSILALRIFGFALLGAALLAWVAGRFRDAPAETLVGLGLVLHPALVKSSLEVGPFAFYAAFALLLHLVVGTPEAVSRRRFAAGVGLQLVLAAVSQVGALLGPALLWLSILRTRRGLPGREALVRAGIVLAVAAPFVALALAGMPAEAGARAAAERTPELAWGSRPFWLLAKGLANTALLLPLGVVSLCLAVGYRITRTPLRWDGLVLLGLGLAVLGALLGLAGTLRVQPYYGLYAVPLLVLAISRLLGGLPATLARDAIGLAVLGALLLDFVADGPALARPGPRPPDAAVVAAAARREAKACPVLVATTHDLVLPLVPHLTDLRNGAASERVSLHALLPPGALPAGVRGTASPLGPVVERWRLPGAGLTLVGVYPRHRLPPAMVNRYVGHLAAFTRAGCTQVLYDRRFPVPYLYRLFGKQCAVTADRGPLRLYRCARPILPQGDPRPEPRR